MRFAFTDDQLAFRDAVRDLLEKECPPAVVRDAWTNADGRSGAAWDALGEMGVLGALVPEADGGLGLTELDVVLLAEETGRAALPEPFVEHVLVGAPIVAGDRAGVATGATTVTAGDPLVPVRDRGRRRGAPRARARSSSRRAARRVRRRGVGRRQPPARPTRRDARTRGRSTRAELSQAFGRGTLGYSAQLLGLARRLLDTTVEYVSERRQFGVPIGSFQAIKHKLADVRIALEFARRSSTAPRTRSPTTTPTRCSTARWPRPGGDAAALAARHALQCHGAIGYSFEHDLHLWMKRVWALVPHLGRRGLAP